MSSLEFARRKKPESAKLIRQLLCFLYLQNDKQFSIERFLESEMPQTSVKAAVRSQYRTFFRYIGEILSCLEGDYGDDWDIFYSEGVFYRGYDFSIKKRKTNPLRNLESYTNSGIVRCIRPIEPSPVHRNRLARTMKLAQEIIEDVARDNKYDDPSVYFFQTIFLPKFKSCLRDDYAEEFGLKPRTVQRDMHAIFSAVSKYFEMNEFCNRK